MKQARKQAKKDRKRAMHEAKAEGSTEGFLLCQLCVEVTHVFQKFGSDREFPQTKRLQAKSSRHAGLEGEAPAIEKVSISSGRMGR